MRNAGLALLFANQFGDEVYGLKLAILLYVLLTTMISTPVLSLSQSQGQGQGHQNDSTAGC